MYRQCSKPSDLFLNKIDYELYTQAYSEDRLCIQSTLGYTVFCKINDIGKEMECESHGIFLVDCAPTSRERTVFLSSIHCFALGFSVGELTFDFSERIGGIQTEHPLPPNNESTNSMCFGVHIHYPFPFPLIF